MLTVTNLTPNVQFIGNVGIEPFGTKTAEFNAAALQSAVNSRLVLVKATAETYQSLRSKIVEDSSTSYTLKAIHENTYRRFTSGDPIQVTVNNYTAEQFVPESQFHFKQAGLGKITYVAGSGVTINTSETLISRKQGSAQTLIYLGDNVFDLIGDLEAAP